MAVLRNYVKSLTQVRSFAIPCVCDDDDYYSSMPEHATTVYEREGDVIVAKVPGGWRKFEGKWTLGFGPKKMVFAPIGPVCKRKRDAIEGKHLQSTAARRRSDASEHRGANRK